MPFLIYYGVFSRVKRLRNIFLKIIIGPLVILLTLFGSVLFIISNNDRLGVYNTKDIGETIKTQQGNFQTQDNVAEANFDLGMEYDGTVLNLVKIAPLAISAGLFRPFIWESRKITYILSALESVFLLVLSLIVFFKIGPLKFVKILVQNPLITYCFLFAILFSLFVGISTLNFGSLVRYKIPCLPFYLVSLFTILHIWKEKQALPTATLIPGN